MFNALTTQCQPMKIETRLPLLLHFVFVQNAHVMIIAAAVSSQVAKIQKIIGFWEI